MRRQAKGPRKNVRKNNCGVTKSRSSRKEKCRSEEGQEENLRNKRTLIISGLLLVRFGEVRRSWEVRESWNKD
jgi:hypothetical protein